MSKLLNYNEINISKIVTDKKILIDSICVAIMIIINYIAAVIGINGGILIIISFILIMELFVVNEIRVPMEIILFICIILIFHCTSIFINEDPKYSIEYLIKFITFGATALFLATTNFNKNIVYNVILVIGFLTIIRMQFIDVNSLMSGNKMGLTYALLPIIYSAIIKINDKIIFKVMSISVIISSIIMLGKISNRGAFLSIFFFLFTYLITMSCNNKRKRYLITIGIMILTIISTNNMLEILTWCQTILNHADISIYAIEKSLYYYGQENFLNGRDLLWNVAIEGIIKSPIVGHGIGNFEQLYGTYCHNIFLQVLWEGGIIGMLPISIMFIKLFTSIVHNPKNEENVFTLFLFSLSFLTLMFSSNLWMNQCLWLLIGLELKKSFLIQKTVAKRNDKSIRVL